MKDKKVREDDGLSFAIKKSIRYHSKRKHFIEKWHNLFLALIALSGSSAFVAIFSKAHILGLIFSAIAALAATLDLVLGLERTIRLYDDLQKRFSDLLQKTILTELSQPDLVIERIAIEKDEPATYRALDLICHNEECKAQGNDDERYIVSWWRKLLCNFMLFSGWYPQKEANKNKN